MLHNLLRRTPIRYHRRKLTGLFLFVATQLMHIRLLLPGDLLLLLLLLELAQLQSPLDILPLLGLPLLDLLVARKLVG